MTESWIMKPGEEQVPPESGLQKALQQGAESVGSAAMMAREAADVQVSMTMARRFPRDQIRIYQRLEEECSRLTLAENASYSYRRGGQIVDGPTIHLARAIARSYGNIDYGWVTLSEDGAGALVMAFAIDLETNTRERRVFQVPYLRSLKHGVKQLTDPRDQYEITSNMASRRVRQCILDIVPQDFLDLARNKCLETEKAAVQGVPLMDRIRAMVKAFAPLGVDQDAIKRRVGHKVETISEVELRNLRKIYVSLKEEAAGVTDFFPPEEEAATPVQKPPAKKGRKARRKALQPEPAPEPAPEPETAPAAQEAPQPALMEVDLDEIANNPDPDVPDVPPEKVRVSSIDITPVPDDEAEAHKERAASEFQDDTEGPPPSSQSQVDWENWDT